MPGPDLRLPAGATTRGERAGGWGHILGDAGGGYDLSVQSLRAVLREYDLHRRGSDLATEILRALCLNNLNELVRWAQTAGKMEIASLTPVVFSAAAAGQETVQEILRSAPAFSAATPLRSRNAWTSLRRRWPCLAGFFGATRFTSRPSMGTGRSAAHR